MHAFKENLLRTTAPAVGGSDRRRSGGENGGSIRDVVVFSSEVSDSRRKKRDGVGEQRIRMSSFLVGWRGGSADPVRWTEVQRVYRGKMG